VKSEPQAETSVLRPQRISRKHINRLKAAAAGLTVGGLVLFAYFVYSVGPYEILRGIERLGLGGFALLLVIYFLRMCTRAWAWTLSVYEPYSLTLKDTIPAVIIGEAMSSLIPLGILISGTSKAVAVRKRAPLVVGLSSVATENLFYSFVTSLFLVLGAFTFLRTVSLAEDWIWTIDILIAAVILLVVLGLVMMVRQWHFLSESCEWLYRKGFAKGILENGRLEARLFENLIYGFYRRYPRRFLPICLLEVTYHLLGILEVWYVLSKITAVAPGFLAAFLLESVSRMITIVFKLIPFVIGVDEAGARFITRSLALGAGVGVTLAIIRKGRILFWTAIGVLLILKRGLSFKEFRNMEDD
jgi:hypothetical protein